MGGWSSYGEFLAFATVLILVPGPDFAVVTKNTLVGGRQRGRWTAVGVAASALVQGTAAASGLSELIVRAQPVFDTIKIAGVVYLAFLGVQALASALRRRHKDLGEPVVTASRSARLGGLRQGFLSNITNPKVLIFYLAILPQFLSRHTQTVWLLAFAWSHALETLVYLMILTTGIHGARGVLQRRKVRRVMDGTTGLVLLGFSARLATERA